MDVIDYEDELAENEEKRLRYPLDVNKLVREKETEFHVSEDISDNHSRNLNQSWNVSAGGRKEFADILDIDSLQLKDDSNEEISVFEYYKSRMDADLSPDKSGGLLKRVITHGEAKFPVTSTSVVRYHYRLYSDLSPDPFEPFDSSRRMNRLYRVDFNRDVTLANTEPTINEDGKSGSYLEISAKAVPGIILGLLSMCLNEHSVFLFSKEYCSNFQCIPFEDENIASRVPVGSKVLCFLSVEDVCDLGAGGQYLRLAERDRINESFELCKRAIAAYKHRGSISFQKKDFLESVRYYRSAFKLLEQHIIKNDLEQLEREELLAVLYTNVALCNLKLKNWKHVRKYANLILDIEMRSATKKAHAKAKYFLAKSELHQCYFNDAAKHAREALMLSREMGEVALVNDSNAVLRDIARQKEKQKIKDGKFCRKIFDDGNELTTKDENASANARDSSSQESSVISPMLREAIHNQIDYFMEDDTVSELPFLRDEYTQEELKYIRGSASRYKDDIRVLEFETGGGERQLRLQKRKK